MSYGPQYGQQPYGQPPYGQSPYGGVPPDQSGLRAQLQVIGIAFLSLGGLSLIVVSILALFNVVNLIGLIRGDGGANFTVLLGLVIQGFHIFSQVAILRAGMCFLYRDYYQIALGGAWLAVVPCCSSCVIIGIPFAVWGLILLYQQDVKMMFDDGNV